MIPKASFTANGIIPGDLWSPCHCYMDQCKHCVLKLVSRPWIIHLNCTDNNQKHTGQGKYGIFILYYMSCKQGMIYSLFFFSLQKSKNDTTRFKAWKYAPLNSYMHTCVCVDVRNIWHFYLILHASCMHRKSKTKKYLR
jgi:hypothetical protein